MGRTLEILALSLSLACACASQPEIYYPTEKIRQELVLPSQITGALNGLDFPIKNSSRKAEEIGLVLRTERCQNIRGQQKCSTEITTLPWEYLESIYVAPAEDSYCVWVSAGPNRYMIGCSSDLSAAKTAADTICAMKQYQRRMNLIK